MTEQDMSQRRRRGEAVVTRRLTTAEVAAATFIFDRVAPCPIASVAQAHLEAVETLVLNGLVCRGEKSVWLTPKGVEALEVACSGVNASEGE